MINVCSCKNRKKNVNINNWLSKALISKYISLFVKYINGTIIYVQLEIQVEYYKCRPMTCEHKSYHDKWNKISIYKGICVGGTSNSVTGANEASHLSLCIV